MNNDQQIYVPGVCNIGPVEIAARKRFGWTGLIITIAVAALLFLVHADPWVRLVLFFPAAAAAMGLIQGYSHFCAGFGMKGFFNFGSELGKTETVQQQKFRKKDKQKAWRIIDASILTGMVVALIAFFG
jgi:hypothetical protein